MSVPSTTIVPLPFTVKALILDSLSSPPDALIALSRITFAACSSARAEGYAVRTTRNAAPRSRFIALPLGGRTRATAQVVAPVGVMALPSVRGGHKTSFVDRGALLGGDVGRHRVGPRSI